MQFELSTHTVAAVIDRPHPQANVRLDYAARARTEEQRQRRREAIWAVLSLIALVLCWDLSARLDRRVLGDEIVTTVGPQATEVMGKPGGARRLRKLSEEAEGEAPRKFGADQIAR